MGILFSAKGPQKEVLQQFKSQYLTHLQNQDLQKEIILEIKDQEASSEIPSSKGDQWWHQQLLRVVEEER